MPDRLPVPGETTIAAAHTAPTNAWQSIEAGDVGHESSVLSSTFLLHQRSAKLFEQSAPSQVRFGEPVSKRVKNELTVNASRNSIYAFKYARFVGEAAGARPGFELFSRPRA